jgi:hypothetical protein
MLEAMSQATYQQQIKFSVLVVSTKIEDMLKKGETHLFYSDIDGGDRQYRPCVLHKHVYDVVWALQHKYKGQVVVSRSPGGIVVDKI